MCVGIRAKIARKTASVFSLLLNPIVPVALQACTIQNATTVAKLSSQWAELRNRAFLTLCSGIEVSGMGGWANGKCHRIEFSL